MSGCLDVWMSGCLYASMSECLDVGMSGSLDDWMHGCLDVWMFGCLAVWMFGCLDVWMFGCLDVWSHPNLFPGTAGLPPGGVFPLLGFVCLFERFRSVLDVCCRFVVAIGLDKCLVSVWFLRTSANHMQPLGTRIVQDLTITTLDGDVCCS